MASFSYIPIQLVDGASNAILNTVIGCPKGYVLHREGSGIVTLRGIVNNPCANFARYKCTFNGNIAIPEEGTVGEISMALSLNGEALLASLARVTPAAVDEYFNITCTDIIDVPRGCCPTMAIRNTSTVDGSPVAINLQNANFTIDRIA